MVEVLAVQEPSALEEGGLITPFRVPALSERGARRRAKLNARAKGLNNPTVREVESIAPGDIPGQTIYRVAIVSQR